MEYPRTTGQNTVDGGDSCTVSWFSAETFKAAVVRNLFSKVAELVSSCADDLCGPKLVEVQTLLRAASFHTQYVNDLCYMIFVRLLSNLDHEECGQSIHAMSALVIANPAVAHVTDANGMTLAHHLAGSFIFSFFLSRMDEPQSTDADQDSHVHFQENGSMSALAADSANPFSRLLHRVITSNRDALYRRNKEGNCPIHVLCSEPIAGSGILEIILQYSPRCAGVMGLDQHKDKYPLHMLMSQITWDRPIQPGSNLHRCIAKLVQACPHAAFHELTEFMVRLHLNVDRGRTPIQRVWSPYSLATVANCTITGDLMTAQLLSKALTQHQCLVRFGAGRRKHTNIIRTLPPEATSPTEYNLLACFSPREDMS
jgi:hypothetical protein